MTQAKLIIFEGGEGVGKSTQLKLLQETHPKFLYTREPGGSAYAEKIRSLIFDPLGAEADARTLFHLFWAARIDHLTRKIIPALKAGQTVVSDRFDLSTFAYQLRGKGSDQALVDLFWQLRQSDIVEQIGQATVQYIYLEMDPRVALARLNNRGGEVTHFDEQPSDFHQRVYDGGHEFMSVVQSSADPASHSVFHIVDAAKSVSEVQADIAARIEKIMG